MEQKQSLSALADKLSAGGPGVKTIKLRQLLEPHREAFGVRPTKMLFPPVEIGSVTLVDQIVLLSLMDFCTPKRIVEIGTFLGYTTRMLLENSSDAIIYSVDLPQGDSTTQNGFDLARVLNDGDYNDRYLTQQRKLIGETYLADLPESILARLRLIRQDSTTLNYADDIGRIDFAFIDGGHDLETVAADTACIRQAVKNGVIVWHDYSSGIHSGVTEFLSNEDNCSEVFHVAGSLCAFEIRKQA